MDGHLRRRLQLVRGLQWVRAAEGDRLSVLLRGHPSDGWPAITDSISRSATGTLVIGGTSAARVLELGSGLADWRPTGRRLMAVAAEEIAPVKPEDVTALAGVPAPRVACVPDELTDLVSTAELLCAKAYAEVLGAEPDCLLGAAPVLDNLLCPQETTVTENMLTSVDTLRIALGAGTPEFFLAVVALRLTADLVTRTAAALLLEGQWPDVVGATERTRARFPLVRLHLTDIREDVTVAGERVPGNSQVAVLTRPDALPRLLDLPLVYSTAEAVLTAIATRHPRLLLTGAPLDRPLAPATGGLAQLPVASSCIKLTPAQS